MLALSTVRWLEAADDRFPTGFFSGFLSDALTKSVWRHYESFDRKMWRLAALTRLAIVICLKATSRYPAARRGKRDA